MAIIERWRGALGGTSGQEERRLRKQQARDLGRQQEDIQYAQQAGQGTPSGAIAQALTQPNPVAQGGGGGIYDFMGRLAQRLPQTGQTGATIQEQLLRQMTMPSARQPYAGPMYGWMRQFPEYTTGYKYPQRARPIQPRGWVGAQVPGQPARSRVIGEPSETYEDWKASLPEGEEVEERGYSPYVPEEEAMPLPLRPSPLGGPIAPEAVVPLPLRSAVETIRQPVPERAGEGLVGENLQRQTGIFDLLGLGRPATTGTPGQPAPPLPPPIQQTISPAEPITPEMENQPFSEVQIKTIADIYKGGNDAERQQWEQMYPDMITEARRRGLI